MERYKRRQKRDDRTPVHAIAKKSLHANSSTQGLPNCPSTQLNTDSVRNPG